jgi:hypothetical protein
VARLTARANPGGEHSVSTPGRFPQYQPDNGGDPARAFIARHSPGLSAARSHIALRFL